MPCLAWVEVIGELLVHGITFNCGLNRAGVYLRELKGRAKNMKNTLLFLAISFLAGCAVTPSPAQQARRAQFSQTIPVCEGEADCTVKWEAAQLWVVHNAGYKIQTATTVLIETYNPGQYETSLAARVTKEPLGGGKYRLIVSTWCNNMFGCSPDAMSAALDFNSKVGSVAP